MPIGAQMKKLEPFPWSGMGEEESSQFQTGMRGSERVTGRAIEKRAHHVVGLGP